MTTVMSGAPTAVMPGAPTTGIQGSLFAQASDEIAPSGLEHALRRELSHGAWVDLLPGWVAGADLLFTQLRDDVGWRAERRRMYDRVVDVPRLVATYRQNAILPHTALVQARESLSAHYRPELPEGFATAGLAFYRDGNDSVAWHGDRIGRGATEDTMVAILSLGAPRTLHLRPCYPDERSGKRQSLRFTLSSGDLLVMGGSCQRTWEHAVLKAPSAGPRMSVQFRPPGVW